MIGGDLLFILDLFLNYLLNILTLVAEAIAIVCATNVSMFHLSLEAE